MRLLLIALFSLLSLSASAEMLSNQLKHHPSPYLALHGNDPTAWQEWNAETVARAKRDREIGGALDAEMQAFSEATRGQAGWPLNVFITPEGYPLYAMLYAPPEDFLQTILKLGERWRQQGPQLSKLAREAAIAPPPAKEAEAQFAPQIAVLYRQRLVLEALEHADSFRGGFGSANKFPQYPQLSALLDAQRQEPNPKLGEFLRLTLDPQTGRIPPAHAGSDGTAWPV